MMIRQEWLNLAFALAVLGSIVWLFWYPAKQKRSNQVQDDPRLPYSVFTREFDLELKGSELDQRLINASPDHQKGWLKIEKDRWRDEIRLADQLVVEHREPFRHMLGDASQFDGRAVTILIDQSGSMREEPMRWAAVASRLAAETLEDWGARVEILGFSTAGWHGGFAYRKWKATGQPQRPGRLCSLLHVVYKAHDEPVLDRANWEAMFNPNTLRENVDGEALEWASARLSNISAASRQLIVLSDGAPVDDATYLHNGGGYLVRHLKSVIGGIESERKIDLSAIGIRHAVDQYYARSNSIEDLTQLPELLAISLAASIPKAAV